jgi:hypothetical protein
MARCTAHHCVDSCIQLSGAERLTQVVICTEVQTRNPIGNVLEGTQQDHSHIGSPTDPSKNPKTIHMREQHIQDEKIWTKRRVSAPLSAVITVCPLSLSLERSVLLIRGS